MPSETKKLPSVLMLLLSALGILISLLIAAGAIWGGMDISSTAAEALTLFSVGVLAFFISLLIIPGLIFSIQKLKGRETALKHASLFKNAKLAMIAWGVLLAAGVLLSKDQSSPYVLAPVTILCVALPIWWLIEFSRRGLARPSLLKEWGTLTIGLTAAPLVIMLVEIMLVIVVALVVMVLLGMQPGTLSEIMELTASLDSSQGGMEALDQLIMNISSNPTIAAALFIVIGVVAPFTEELFKPLAVWLMRRKSLRTREGFVLGLISGGAFTLLESASLVSQITTQDWLLAVVLRASTGMLHIGLSGMVGYGIAKARVERHWGSALLSLLAGTTLHGLWNSMALLNGFSSTPLTSAESLGLTAGGVLSLICMLLVFAAVVYISLRLNARLRREQHIEAEILNEEMATG